MAKFLRALAGLSLAAAGIVLLTSGASAPEYPTLHQPVEILTDRWGVPHIYAKNTEDLFFAQGWITARDRLFQLDLWRRVGTGKLAEVLGTWAVPRDRIARLVRYRGDWNKEWSSYSPDAKQIATAFTNGINAYIRTLGGRRTPEFAAAGYDPGFWAPEDVTARIAGLSMMRNVTSEVQRSQEVAKFGLDTVQKYMPPDPFRPLDPPKDLDLASIKPEILHDFSAALANVQFPDQGSNNWVIDGTMSATGKPLLANDPHRPIQLPSLRKTVHLVAPGWDVIGAGEPALPGVALGHNEEIAFGFTIVGTDQQDLYVEKLKPDDPTQYFYRGEWKKMEVEQQEIPVKGAEPQHVELHYTIHGPVLYEDSQLHRAYALKSVAAEPGAAGYLSALSLIRAHNWNEFKSAMANYKVPTENIVYADRAGNIGWIAGGLAPIRKNWSGLFPVPGDTGEYEWSGFLASSELPQVYNPANHHVATANHNILPKGYDKQLSYAWATPDRYHRIEEMLSENRKFNVEAFEKMQQDVISLNARGFMQLLGPDSPLAGWNGELRVDSDKALLYEVWTSKLSRAVFGADLGARVSLQRTLAELEEHPNPKAIEDALTAAKAEIAAPIADQPPLRTWGDLHKVFFRHPLNRKEFNRGPFARPGDAFTVNATSGPNFRQTAGASYREIIDVSNWDASVMTNVPGESGDPASKHYDDLIQDWLYGQYHAMPYSRKAVEAATVDRMMLLPRK